MTFFCHSGSKLWSQIGLIIVKKKIKTEKKVQNYSSDSRDLLCRVFTYAVQHVVFENQSHKRIDEDVLSGRKYDTDKFEQYFETECG